MGCVFCRYFFRKDLLILLLPAVIIILAGHAGALGGFLIQAAAGLAVGLPIYRRFGGREMPGGNSLAGLILSWFLGSSINNYIVWIALHWDVNYSWIYFLFFLGEIALFRGPLLDEIMTFSRRAKSLRLAPGQWAIIGWAIFMLPYALVPLYVYDDCVRHILYPKQVALFGRHVFDPNIPWSMDTEVYSQSCYTISRLLGGEFAQRLSNLAAPVAGMLLLEDYCRRTFGGRAAFFTALILISTPILGWTTMVIYLETFNFLSAAAFVVVGLSVFRRFDRKFVILSFALAAAAFLYKQQAVFVALPMCAMLSTAAVFHCLRQKSYQPAISLSIGMLCAAILMAPFLTQNFIVTGNPVFPWLNGVFRSEYLPPVNSEGFRFDQPLNLGCIADLTFHGERFIESGSLLFGVNFFMLAGFIPLMAVKRRRLLLKTAVLVLFAAAAILWWKITSPNLRYFMGPLVAGSILLGVIANELWEQIRQVGRIKVLGIAALAVAIIVNAASLMNSLDRICPYPLVEAFTKRYQGVSPYMATLEEIKKVFSAARDKYGMQASCLLATPPFLCMADQRVEGMDWAYYRNWSEMGKWQNEEEAFDWIFHKKKFACIIAFQQCKIPLLDSPRFRNMVSVEFSNVGYLLLGPKPGALDQAANGN